MSVDRFNPHIFVLPEDDANRQLAVGFQTRISEKSFRQFKVLPPLGGWEYVVKGFLSDHIRDMNRFPERLVVLLLDFDKKVDRCKAVKSLIPADLIARVFVLGTLTEPEDLKPQLGSYEAIGEALAEEAAQTRA